MPTDPCFLLGAGGHAKVVLEAWRACFPACHVEVRDDAPGRHGAPFLGLTVSTPCIDAILSKADVHVAIGDNAARQRLAATAEQSGANLRTIVHPDASLSPSARIGRGVFVAAQAVIGPEAVLDDGVIVNHAAVVDHDCQIGAWTHIAPRAVLGGGVQVGAGALLGSGCVVLPGLHIGTGAIVGAGAVVTRNVAPGQTVRGIPAK